MSLEGANKEKRDTSRTSQVQEQVLQGHAMPPSGWRVLRLLKKHNVTFRVNKLTA